MRFTYLGLLIISYYYLPAQMPGVSVDMNTYWQFFLQTEESDQGAKIHLGNPDQDNFLRLQNIHEGLDIMNPVISRTQEQPGGSAWRNHSSTRVHGIWRSLFFDNSWFRVLEQSWRRSQLQCELAYYLPWKSIGWGRAISSTYPSTQWCSNKTNRHLLYRPEYDRQY